MKTLIMDEDAVSRPILVSALMEWGCEVTIAGDGDEARRALQAEDCAKLAILDCAMPEGTGDKICEMVRSRATDQYTYIILLAEADRFHDVIHGLKSGADDYIIRPFAPLELAASLISCRRFLDVQQRLSTSLQALRNQVDALTGASSHGAIIEILEREINRAERQQQSVGVVMVDLDLFKKTNDAYGHLGGDEALREATRRMRTSVRRYDAVGRYGGEEFLIVLPGCNQATAMELAERIRARIAAQPVHYLEHSIAITASFGVAAFTPPRSEGLRSILQAADAALYRAKAGGRNRVEGTDAEVPMQRRIDTVPPGV